MKAGVWENNVALVPLPDSVLDLSRLGPGTGTGPANKPAGNRESGNENMDTADSGSLQG